MKGKKDTEKIDKMEQSTPIKYIKRNSQLQLKIYIYGTDLEVATDLIQVDMCNFLWDIGIRLLRKIVRVLI